MWRGSSSSGHGCCAQKVYTVVWYVEFRLRDPLCPKKRRNPEEITTTKSYGCIFSESPAPYMVGCSASGLDSSTIYGWRGSPSGTKVGNARIGGNGSGSPRSRARSRASLWALLWAMRCWTHAWICTQLVCWAVTGRPSYVSTPSELTRWFRYTVPAAPREVIGPARPSRRNHDPGGGGRAVIRVMRVGRGVAALATATACRITSLHCVGMSARIWSSCSSVHGQGMPRALHLRTRSLWESHLSPFGSVRSRRWVRPAAAMRWVYW